MKARRRDARLDVVSRKARRPVYLTKLMMVSIDYPENVAVSSAKREEIYVFVP